MEEGTNDGQEHLRALFDQCKEESHDFINIEGLASLWQKLGYAILFSMAVQKEVPLHGIERVVLSHICPTPPARYLSSAHTFYVACRNLAECISSLLVALHALL